MILSSPTDPGAGPDFSVRAMTPHGVIPGCLCRWSVFAFPTDPGARPGHEQTTLNGSSRLASAVGPSPYARPGLGLPACTSARGVDLAKASDGHPFCPPGDGGAWAIPLTRPIRAYPGGHPFPVEAP